jgi:hypothetical protein
MMTIEVGARIDRFFLVSTPYALTFGRISGLAEGGPARSIDPDRGAMMPHSYPQLALGLITCPRQLIDVRKTIAQLRRTGFSEPLQVFCEPFWSLYTPVRDQPLVEHQQGWVQANRGRDAWGTQSMCFSRRSAHRLLDYRPLCGENQLRGATDAVVAQCFVDAGIPCYYHNPSLTDHLGRISSIGNNWHDNHVGFHFDPEYQPNVDDKFANTISTKSTSVVVTVYQDNIPGEVLAAQSNVVQRFLPSGCDF